jgi:hypothetical protein
VTLELDDEWPPKGVQSEEPDPPGASLRADRTASGRIAGRSRSRRTGGLPAVLFVVVAVAAGATVVNHRRSFDALASEGIPVMAEAAEDRKPDPDPIFDRAYVDLAYDWAGVRHRTQLVVKQDDLPRGPQTVLLVDPTDPGRVMIAGVRHRTGGFEFALLLLGILGTIVAVVGVAQWRRGRRAGRQDTVAGSLPQPGARLDPDGEDDSFSGERSGQDPINEDRVPDPARTAVYRATRGPRSHGGDR